MKPVFCSLKSFLGKPYNSVGMYLPIALVAFVLCLPSLASAEITPERPVSDITLVLNETVTIQFPGGTTDRTHKKEKWRYRIVKTPRLPKGLIFDQATRTLSGTPSEEHDAVHSYRIRYVWGKKNHQQEKLVIPFRLVVKKPDPIVVEITPQRLLSDITLEMNETVSVQFPGGTADPVQENGEWKYRIKRHGVNDNSLPAGLTFDRDTRTLSGTPSEEHDATYAYHIRYVWGEGKDNHKRLVIPFRLVVEHPIAARIRSFVGQASSVGEFAKGLPDLHKSHALYMVASQALDSAFVSEDHPRMISFGANARTIFAWGSDSNSDRYDTVEFIAAGERRWHFGTIDFAEDPPVVTRDPEECQACHNNHPLWAAYPGWPGTLFETKNAQYLRRSHDEALYKRFQGSPDPRLSTVGHAILPRLLPHRPAPGLSRGETELTFQLAIRHAELLVKGLIAQPDDFYTIAEKFVCGKSPAVRAHWPKRVIDLKRMGEGLVQIDPNARPTSYIYWTGYTSLEEIIMLLIINHLYEIDPEIKAIYDSTSNTDSSPEYPHHLHFEPGTATAADELRSRMELVKLADQAYINKRRALYRAGKLLILHSAYLRAMMPKVCNALRERDND